MIENHPKTMWLYARNEEKDNKNIERLVKLSRERKVPVARLECQWISNRVQYKVRYQDLQICKTTLSSNITT